jgi:hypothetical protein
MFVSVYLPTEQHKMKRLRDDFKQDLKMRLVAFTI